MTAVLPKMREISFTEAKIYLGEELLECHIGNDIFRFQPDAKAWTITLKHKLMGRWFVHA